MEGRTASGTQKATSLGFPTVNLSYESKNVPDTGIYAGALIYDGEEYPGAVCLAPNGKLEIYCFETIPFTHSKEVSVAFMKRMSDYINGSDDEMKEKIARDVETAKQFFVDSEEKIG